MNLGEATDSMRRGLPMFREAWAASTPDSEKPEKWATAYVILMAPVGLLASQDLPVDPQLWRKREVMLIAVTHSGDRFVWSPEAKDFVADDWEVYTGAPA